MGGDVAYFIGPGREIEERMSEVRNYLSEPSSLVAAASAQELKAREEVVQYSWLLAPLRFNRDGGGS